ncbi:MAG: hypothetical protein Q9187_004584 [Circinaria calcarea]
MTPPLDEEEENEESRLFEAQARKELENDGCPPCYPLDLEIPLRNPPEKYQPIIGYWQSFPGTGDVVLRAELSDWRKFRSSQSRVRRRFRNKPFSKFEDEVRERRRRHELGGDLRLIFDLEQQSRLENWIEFQHYHLKRFERVEKKRDGLKQELDEARKKAEDTDAAGSTRAAEIAEAVQQIVENTEWDLERHKVLLQWIEQERRAMDPGYPTPIEKDKDDQDAAPKAVRRASTRALQKRRLETSGVLGKVRISKAMPKKQNMQTQTPNAPELEPAIQDSDATPQSSIPQAPKRRETMLRRTKEETPLHQLRPQRVAKAKRFTEARVESLSGTRSFRAGQTRSPDRAPSKYQPARQRSQPAPEYVMARSGRRSRQPVRWAPE